MALYNGLSGSEVTEYSADTAKANNLKPYDYFEYLLSEIPEHMGVIPTDLFWINFFRGLKIFPNRSEKITSKSTVAKAYTVDHEYRASFLVNGR